MVEFTINDDVCELFVKVQRECAKASKECTKRRTVIGVQVIRVQSKAWQFLFDFEL